MLLKIVLEVWLEIHILIFVQVGVHNNKDYSQTTFKQIYALRNAR